MIETKKNNALLFIEDNPLLLRAYQQGFENKNIEVHVAYDGDTGIQIAKNKKPQVILLDLTVHGMGGLEVLEEVRKNEEIKDTVVIIFTMSDDPKDKERAIEKGANEYLIKSEHTLEEVINVVLKHFSHTEEG